jgi:probable rRNA maturation factor
MIDLDLQIATEEAVPSEDLFEQWVAAALAHRKDDTELTVRVVDAEESHGLNYQYRGKDSPTNVLSFPFETLDHVNLPLIGDVVICAPIVIKEAEEQEKSVESHWAHLTIHGILHLLGYDHVEQDDAEAMESMEIKILQKMGYSNPYHVA